MKDGTRSLSSYGASPGAALRLEVTALERGACHLSVGALRLEGGIPREREAPAATAPRSNSGLRLRKARLQDGQNQIDVSVCPCREVVFDMGACHLSRALATKGPPPREDPTDNEPLSPAALFPTHSDSLAPARADTPGGAAAVVAATPEAAAAKAAVATPEAAGATPEAAVATPEAAVATPEAAAAKAAVAEAAVATPEAAVATPEAAVACAPPLSEAPIRSALAPRVARCVCGAYEVRACGFQRIYEAPLEARSRKQFWLKRESLSAPTPLRAMVQPCLAVVPT